MKKTLLMAAAALAAGVISSQAGVYSQNIVGYVNVALPAGFTAIGNPLNNADGFNYATNVLQNVPDFSYVYVWNGASYNSYEVYQNQYYDSAGNGIVPTPTLTVGNGLFVQAASPFTNTFVGTVVLTNGASGTTTTNVANLPAGFTFIAPTLPIGGGVISSLQMGNIPDFSYIYVWNVASQSYTGAESYQGTWYDTTGNFTVAEPTVGVGSAFFVDAASAFTWSLVYTNQ